MKEAVKRYLLENYSIDEDKADELAEGIYFYLVEFVFPDVAKDNDLKVANGCGTDVRL